jgi:hypothetical protein
VKYFHERLATPPQQNECITIAVIIRITIKQALASYEFTLFLGEQQQPRQGAGIVAILK